MITFHLSTSAVPTASRALAKAVLGIVSEYLLDKETLYNIDLALSEACANVVRHAYPEAEPARSEAPEDQAREPEGPPAVEITIAIEPRRTISLEITDYGCGFGDLPMIIKNAHPEEEGGRGLYIMSQLTDELELRACGGRNTVILTMHIEEHLWKT